MSNEFCTMSWNILFFLDGVPKFLSCPVWKQTVLKKVIRPKRRLIKFVASIKANFNQNIFPQSIYIFTLWKFEQEDAWCFAIHWLFLFITCSPRLIQCAALLLDLDKNHAQDKNKQNQIKFMLKLLNNRNLWWSSLYGFYQLGGSRAGTLCVLLPCQINPIFGEEWWHTWCCQPLWWPG